MRKIYLILGLIALYSWPLQTVTSTYYEEDVVSYQVDEENVVEDVYTLYPEYPYLPDLTGDTFTEEVLYPSWSKDMILCYNALESVKYKNLLTKLNTFERIADRGLLNIEYLS